MQRSIQIEPAVVTDDTFASAWPRAFEAVHGATMLYVDPSTTASRWHVAVVSLATGDVTSTKRPIPSELVPQYVKHFGGLSVSEYEWYFGTATQSDANQRVGHWQRRVRTTENDSVYFIQAEIGGPIKIGSAICIDRRVEQFQKGCPFTLHVIGSISSGGAKLEKSIHRKFQKYRVRGEWFRDVPEIRKYITKHAARR